MNWNRIGSGLCAVLLGASFATGAQPRAEPLPSPSTGWPQAVEAAWQRSQEHAESQARLGTAEAQRTAAQALWAAPPSVELEHLAGRSSSPRQRETEAAVIWPLWLPGQRQARQSAADADVHGARMALDAARWRLAGEVHQAGLAVLAQQAEARDAELQLRLLKALADDVDRRVKAGDLARADAMGARAELLQAQAQQRQAQLREQQARERWRLLTGLGEIPIGTIAAITPSPVEHPELTMATAAVERARRKLDVAERSRRDPPELGVRMRRETDATGSLTSAGLTLRVPLGTADRSATLLAQARGELLVAEADETRVRARLALEAETARLQAQAASAQLDAERERAALLRQRAELIEKSFRAGDTALPELLRALAAAAQADAAVVRQEAASQQAQARLAQFPGVLP